jgi:uncharacterized protein (DUF983 family)
MTPSSQVPIRNTIQLIAKGLCPQCHVGKITQGFIGMAKVCPHCQYNLHPESGYYLGAMMVGFLAVSILTIPPVIILKLMGVDDSIILAYPLIQYLILGPIITHYSKVIWAHLGYRTK